MVFLCNSIKITKSNTQAKGFINKWAELFNAKKIESTFFTAVKNIQLEEKEEKAYYDKVIAFAEKYPTDKDCVKIMACANISIAKSLNN